MGLKRFLTVEALEAVGRKAVEAGCFCDSWRDGSGIRRLIRWDISGGCIAAVPVELHARYSAQHRKRVKPLTVIMETKCRKCGWCRDLRRKEWAAKARVEYTDAVRTWFVTLTLTPDAQYMALTRARALLGIQGVDYDALASGEQFTERVRIIGQEITRFIKRVRKNSGAKIRYLLVAEAHKSGDPHFHMLIHEVSAEQPLRKHVIKDAWTIGFSKLNLCDDPRAAVYLCKYLAKDARSRVRASFGYGSHKNQSRSMNIASENEAWAP